MNKHLMAWIQREHIEPIDPDSLNDAFEVADNEIEHIYQTLKIKKQ